jgi:hypothetical protein
MRPAIWLSARIIRKKEGARGDERRGESGKGKLFLMLMCQVSPI